MGYNPLYILAYWSTFEHCMPDQRYQKELAAFGHRLRELRQARGMIQLDLDVKSGIDRSEISKIETAQKNIEFQTLVRLAQALDVELYEFFTPSKEKDAK